MYSFKYRIQFSNRQFRVKLDNFYSCVKKLYNGIPQGSPLSVILFIIAFDELSDIVLKYTKVEHSLYPDDLVLFSKCKDISKTATDFSNILTDLSILCNHSVARISRDKSKILHICRKTSCLKHISLSSNFACINNVTNLKILGIIFDSSFNFKSHCLNLKNN